MIFAAILAGGTGSRMGNEEKPKQYMLLGNKPIILHTIEKFHINHEFEKIIVLCPKQWIKYQWQNIQSNPLLSEKNIG